MDPVRSLGDMLDAYVADPIPRWDGELRIEMTLTIAPDHADRQIDFSKSTGTLITPEQRRRSSDALSASRAKPSLL